MPRATRTFRQMAEMFRFKYVISTLRGSRSRRPYPGSTEKPLDLQRQEFYESKRYGINPIIDRVSGSDSFSGGVIHGLLTKADAGRFVAASA